MSLSVFQRITALTDDELTELVKNNHNKKQIFAAIGIKSRDSRALKLISERITSLNLDTTHFSQTNGGERKYPKDFMESITPKSLSWTELLENMGLRMVGNNISTAKRLVKKYKLDITHFDSRRAAQVTISKRHYPDTKIYSDAQIFTENSYASTSTAKRRILKDSLIPYECSSCGLKDTWNDKPIVLQLEHVNGIKNDHRLENLTFLCPNCHSQTSTWGTKKRA